MGAPVKLLVEIRPDGSVAESWVPLTDEERAQTAIDAAAGNTAAAARGAQLALADKLEQGTATPDELRHALATCLRSLGA